MRYVIGSRGSKLALRQAQLVKELIESKFPEHEWVIETFTTTGDRNLDKPVFAFGGKGAFLKEIEEALLAGKAQLAVHSLKDVPAKETPGLKLSAFLQREDPRDVWVSTKEEMSLLPSSNTVGTSSLRRTLLIEFYRPDLKVQLMRGNLDTRLSKLKAGLFDAIIIAAAGLHRLQLFDSSIMHYLNEEAFIPAVGQGILVVQTNSQDTAVEKMVKELNHPETETTAKIERSFLENYEGGCHLPIGAFATKRNDRWNFRAFIGGVKSHRMIQSVVEEQDPLLCAASMFQKLKAEGADELLAELEETELSGN
jgi:hydroxymethylbilane synthase